MRVLLLCTATFLAPLAQAQTFAVLPQAGLAGYGATVQWGFSPYLALSAGYTGGDFAIRDVETDDARYDGDIRLRNPQLQLNWAPFGGHFRVSAGLVAGNSSFDLTAREFKNPAAAPVESVNITADYKQSLSPLLTIGWETPLQQRGLGYHLSAGAIYAGGPDVGSTAKCKSTPPLGAPSCQAFTAQERARVEDELRRYRFLPVLQAGLLFRL